jgi:hypothetical protein
MHYMSARKPLRRGALLSGLKRMRYEAVTRIAMLFMCVMQAVAPQHSGQMFTVECFLQEE